MRILAITGHSPAEKMGGAEYQTWLIAQGMANLGHDISLLTTLSYEEGSHKAGDVTVHKVPDWRLAGWERHRTLITEFIQSLAPDICYVRVFEDLAPILRASREVGIQVISTSCALQETSPFLTGHYPLDPLRHLRSAQTTKHLRSFLSIRNSAAHVCISKTLRRKMRRWFPQKRIRVIWDGEPVPPLDCLHKGSSGQIIWVNNMKALKRPEAFIKLARRLPQFQFMMIGRIDNDRFGKKIEGLLKKASANLQYMGPMEIDRTNLMIGQSDLLLYTSLPVEGFGNSFLQAWLRGVPTASLSFDPDGILEREGLGRCSRSFEQLVGDVKELMEDAILRLRMGRRARDYAVRHHSAQKMVANYEALFGEVLGNTE